MTIQGEDYASVQVTYVLPKRVLQWAIAQVERYGVRVSDHDHKIAVLISTHKESRVKEARIRSS